MAISLNEVKENELLPDYIVREIPKTCECGAEIVFSNSLKQAYCSNEDCYLKVTARLYQMAKMIGLTNLSEETCKKICKTYRLTSPYQLLLLEQVIDEGITVDLDIKTVIDDLKKLNKSYRLWEIVKMSCIDGIEAVAEKLFSGYNNLSAAFDDIEFDKASFIAEKLGIKNSESSVLAVNIYNQLMKHKDELLFGETQFDIIENKGKQLYISIDGYIKGFKNKSEYIHYINKAFGHKFNIMLVNTVSNQLDVLVVDKDISSNKVKAATKINNDYLEECIRTGKINPEDAGNVLDADGIKYVGELIAVLNSEEFIDRLQEMTGGAD